MIYTLTLNPSLDYITYIDNFMPGAINRTTSEKMLPGGKGINVSTVLSELGVANKAIYYYGGFAGRELNSRLYEAGLDTLPIEVDDGLTRINIKVLGSMETQINGKGPAIDNDDIENLMQALSELKPEDYLVLSGSLPPGLKGDFYGEICRTMNEKHVKVILDGPAKSLKYALRYEPFLIKPNKEELLEFCDKKTMDDDELIEACKLLQESGVQNVCVSLGADGAVLYTKEHEYIKMPSVLGHVVSSVGAGDSLVAGFLASYVTHNDYREALKLGIASGAATAFCEGLASKENIINCYKNIL